MILGLGRKIRSPGRRISSERLFFGLFLFLAGWSISSSTSAQSPTAWYDVEIVRTYPHDSGAFTQGLIFRNGFLYESTGRNGFSTLRKVRLETGEVIQHLSLDHRYYAEGLTDWKDSLIQLTWKSKAGFVYDIKTFSLKRTFEYRGQGWGLATYGNRLVMSDGTATLRFLDPVTFEETGRLDVTDSGTPVSRLNELEMVRGKIFANVWKTKRIVMIDPENGQVVGKIDLSTLMLPEGARKSADVLNGIAYDADEDRLFITGKLWPALFEIRIWQREDRINSG